MNISEKDSTVTATEAVISVLPRLTTTLLGVRDVPSISPNGILKSHLPLSCRGKGHTEKILHAKLHTVLYHLEI